MRRLSSRPKACSPRRAPARISPSSRRNIRAMPLRAEGGDLGFVQQKDFPGPLGDTLFAMKVGDIAGAREVAVRLSHPQARGDSGGRGQAIRRGARRARFAVSPGARRGPVRRTPGTDVGALEKGEHRHRQASPKISGSRAVRSPNSCAAAAPSHSVRASTCSRRCSATPRSTRARSAARSRSATIAWYW